MSLCIFLITSCSENESITQGSSTEFKGLSKDQLTEISVSQVTKLTVNDESYISSSKYLREKIINSSTSKRKKRLEFGDYYSIVDHQNRELKLLRIGGEDSDQQYFVKMNDEYYFLDFALNSADGEDTSNFTFIFSDINGNLLSDSNNGRTQKAW